MTRYTALITGGSKGIGADLGQRLIEKGYEVVSLSRGAPEWSDSRLHHVEVDLLDAEAAADAAARIADDLPAILVTRATSIALLLPALMMLSLPFWPGRAALPFIAIMGILDGIALLCVLSAGSLPGAQYAAVASSTFGMITVILAWVLLGERLTLRQWVGCATAFAGIGYLAL